MTRADPLVQGAIDALLRQDYASATALCERALAARRKNPEALDVLSQVAWESGDATRSIDYLEQAVKLDPKSPRLRTNLGRAYVRAGRFAHGVAQFDRALKLDPTAVQAAAEKAAAYEQQGKDDRAARAIRPFLRGAPAPPIAAVHLRLLARAGDLDAAAAFGTTVAAAGHPPSMALRHLLFELARVHEKRGDLDAAFDVAQRANATKAARFDRDRHRAMIDAIIAATPRATLDAWPRPAAPSDAPVFVFGAPRSGTTLVERILHAHPEAYGTGERGVVHALARRLPEALGATTPYPMCLDALTAEHVEALAADLVARLAAPAPAGTRRIVDKSLDNGLHLGLVTVLLPTATLIHCRRDPVDNGLSCFMSRLASAAFPWAGDLADIGFALREHDRLMAHWRDVLPERIVEVDYEALIADQERVSRAIVAAAGLEWDDACLRFHEAKRDERTLSFDQVNRPIYRTSVGRAEAFGARLDPLRAALGEA